MLMLMVSLLLGAAKADSTDIPKTPKSSELSLIYTGNLKGMARALLRFPTLETFENHKTDSIQIKGVHGILNQGSFFLHTEKYEVAELLSFLNGGSIECGKENEVWAIKQPLEILFQYGEGLSQLPKTFKSQRARSHNRRSCQNKKGDSAILWAPSNADVSLLNWNLENFEFRRGVSIESNDPNQKMLLIGRPSQSAGRIVNQILEKKKQNPNAIYVDSGNFLDGASSVKHGLSMHRSIGIETLKRLNPAALSPGENELVMGANSFIDEVKEEGLPYVATNWTTKNINLSLPKSRRVAIMGPQGSISAAFLGILDPQLHNKIPLLAEEGITINDPVTAAQAEIDRLTKERNPPNVIVVLTTGNPTVLHQLRKSLKGADLAIGDPTMATLRIANRKVSLKEKSVNAKAAPLTLAMDGLSEAKLLFDNEKVYLKQIDIHPILTPASVPEDSLIRRKLTINRAKAYTGQSEPLLKPPNSQLRHKEWQQLVCKALRQGVDADMALIRPLKNTVFLPGALSKKDLADSLAILDEVEIHWITGAKLLRFLDQAASMNLISCGVELGVKKPKLKGRLIDTENIYAIATTDRTRLSSGLKTVIPAHQLPRILDQKAMNKPKKDDGTALLLREAALSQIEDVSKQSGVEKTYDIIAKQNEQRKPPLLTFRMRSLGLGLERFQGAENDAYSEVPETLINTPSSATFSTTADAALEYSSQNLNADFRYVADFGELTTDSDTQEVNDNWVLSTSVSAPGWAIGSYKWMPYGELSYDSEFTATEQEDGSLNSLQSDLSITLGYTMRFQGMWKNIKVGILANRDISQIDEKPTEFAGRLQWETRKVLQSHLIWTTSGDVSYFPKTSDDDASDLSWRLWGESKLALPLTRYLSIAVYAQGLGATGRVESTKEFVGSWNMGCALDLSGAFNL